MIQLSFLQVLSASLSPYGHQCRLPGVGEPLYPLFVAFFYTLSSVIGFGLEFHLPQVVVSQVCCLLPGDEITMGCNAN